MRRTWIAAVALVATACASTGPVQCGPCAGPGYLLSGGPEHVSHARVTECVTGLRCVTHRSALGSDPHQYQQLLPMLASTSWQDVDGATLTVTVRTPRGVWQGRGALRFSPGGDGPCDCSALSAEVPLAVVSPPG